MADGSILWPNTEPHPLTVIMVAAASHVAKLHQTHDSAGRKEMPLEPTTKHMLAGMNVHIGEANNHVAQFITPDWTLELFVRPINTAQVVLPHDPDSWLFGITGVQLEDAEGIVYATTVSYLSVLIKKVGLMAEYICRFCDAGPDHDHRWYCPNNPTKR